MTETKKIKEIQSSAIALHDIGVNDWALTKEQALQMFDELERENIAVLGGDVYQLLDGVPVANYDNWYCSKNTDDKLDSFVHRSIEKSRDYVLNYNNSNDKDILFVIVIEQT